MITKYIIDINLPVNFIPHDFEGDGAYQELILTPELINNDFHLWLKDIGLKICPKSSRYFIRPPFMIGSIHVDAYDQHASKLNFIYDSVDAVMYWYRLLPKKTPITSTNYQNEIIRSYNQEDCEKVLTIPTNKHCLINGKMMHRIDIGKNNNQYRKCYSLLLVDSNDRRISWGEALEIFKPYFAFS
jgi:hypothetical protein